MGTQISLKLSDRMISNAKRYSQKHGFDSLQDFIRELLRQKLFEQDSEKIGGKYTSKASEQSLAKSWLSVEEDEAWEHLQKEK